MQTEIRIIKGMMLLPPAPDKCQICGAKHDHRKPHDKDSLYYQCWFYERHGRYPTWEDAMRHCARPLREAWEKELRLKSEWEK